MRKQKRSWTWLKIILCGLLLTVFIGPALAAEKPMVIYDKETDKLSIKAEKVPLKDMLKRIGLLSGVAFYMDPAAERPVTMLLKDQHLERGLKKMFQAHNLSSAMIYEHKEGQDTQKEPLLIAVKVVPNAGGLGFNAQLVPVVDVNGEAIIRSFSRHPPRGGQELPSIFGYTEERWQVRLKMMSPEKRKRIEADMQKRQEREAARQAKREQYKADRKARKEAEEAEDRAEEEEFKASNPELYELRQQQREEFKQQILEERAMEQTIDETE